jgi:ATP/maltotriose-dependent transcriptional regulator MalT
MTPLDLLKDPRKSGAEDRTINSHYFATRAGTVFSVCLEVPYAQTHCPLDAAMARAYGASMLRAWVRTRFVAANEPRDPGDAARADLLALRTQFLKMYRSKPKDAEALAVPHLDSTAPLPFRAEANNLVALLRLHQGRFAEALGFAETADQDAHATNAQKATALLTRVQIVCGTPRSSAVDVEAALSRWQRFPYPSPEHQARVFEVISEFFHGRGDLEKALGFARRQLAVARVHEQGRVLIRVAHLEDRLDRPGDAVASRQEAVRILRARLGSTPERSVFGALMAVDLFDALQGIPSASIEEKRAAGAWVLGHEIVSPAIKARVRQALAEFENPCGEADGRPALPRGEKSSSRDAPPSTDGKIGRRVPAPV